MRSKKKINVSNITGFNATANGLYRNDFTDYSCVQMTGKLYCNSIDVCTWNDDENICKFIKF